MGDNRAIRKGGRGAVLLTALAAGSGLLAAPAQAQQGQLPEECSGTSSVECHFDVPPGVYNVTARIGGDEAGSTRISTEARRALLAETTTEAGEVVERTFTVDVRDPEGQPTGDTGSPGLDLRFLGEAPRLSDLRVTPAPETPKILIAGDSTVCDQESVPYTGWGQQLPRFLRGGIAVANYADSGESTDSFLAGEVLFGALESRIKPGDLVLIQLAHNDKETTAEDYRANLTEMAERVRAKDGKPVFVTPIVRRHFENADSLSDTGLIITDEADLPAEMRSLGEELDVPVIDLTKRSEALVLKLGEEGSQDLYLTREEGDDTHTSIHGATVYASMIRDGLKAQGLVPAELFR